MKGLSATLLRYPILLIPNVLIVQKFPMKKYIRLSSFVPLN